MLRWLKTVVVSDEEKAQGMRQAGTGKASASEPLRACRDQEESIETRAPSSPCYEPGGYPFTGQVVLGMKVARARSAEDRACIVHAATLSAIRALHI